MKIATGIALGAVLLVAAPAQDKRDVSFENKLLGTIEEGIEVQDWLIEFSPTGRSVAYRAQKGHKGNKGFVVVGDKKGEEFDEVGWRSTFSPDGKVVAYKAKKGDKRFVVVGDKKSEEFDQVDSPTFSPDGKLVAYTAQKGDKGFVVVGDKKGEKFDWVYSPTFSPNGTKVAYGARKGRELWWKVMPAK